MKRILTVCSVIFILCALLASSPAQAANPAAPEATSYHNITIDGTNDFVADETVYSTIAGSYYFSWNATNFYFGANNADVTPESQGSTKWIMLYIDSDPQGSTGTTTGVTYNTQQPSLPFTANYHFRWKADDSYIDLQTWDGDSWEAVSEPGLTRSRNGDYIEFGIPRAKIGGPETVRLVAFMINELNGVESTYFMAPNTNNDGAHGLDPDFTHYFGFALTAGISPNWSCNVDTVPSASVSGGSFGTGTIWTDDTTPNSSTAHVIIGNSVTQNMSSAAKCVTIISGGILTGGSNTLSLYGDWINNGTFNYSSTSNEVKFVSTNHTIGGSSSTTFYNLTIDSAGPAGSTPTVVNIGDATNKEVQPKIDGVFDYSSRANNPIIFNQTLDVPYHATNYTRFLHLTKSDDTTMQYQGVDLRPVASNLGTVTVSILLRRSGLLDSCTGNAEDAAAGNHALRCFQITPDASHLAVPAFVKFWLEYHADGASPDERNGIAIVDIYVWSRDAEGSYTVTSGDTTSVDGSYTHTDGTINHFSPFMLGTDNEPTSVELVDLSARPAAIPTAAPILLGAAAFLTGGILAFRKLRRR